ncbi:MAG: DUF4190 domain-containing protein [Flavobacteriales bacterium]|nr:DUF4190 domain-containing protein [Flavobacteriales bacterium]
MTRSGKLLILLLLALFAGCSTSSDVVGKGPFQKRKYRPGWDLSSLRTQHRKAIPKARIVHERMRPITIRVERFWPDPPPLAPLSASLDLIPSEVVTNRTSTPLALNEAASVPLWEQPEALADGETTITGDRRWNRMAMASGVFLVLSAVAAIAPGGTAILLYLLSFAFITGIIGLVLARKNKEKGQLIAIAGIALPLLFVAFLFAIEKNVF